MNSSWCGYWRLGIWVLLLVGCRPLKRFARQTFSRPRTYSASEESARYLRRLDLQGALPGPVPQAIYRLPRLEALDISNNELDSTAVDRRRLPTLKKLVWRWHAN